MIKVAKISAELAAQLANTTYDGTAFFNPVQDALGNWCISLETAKYLDAHDYRVIEWVEPDNEEN